MSTAIKVENLSKAYQLGQIGTGTISRDLERWWASVRGKEDPFLKIGESNDRTAKADSKNDIVWSLKELNFEINQGDSVGIIGRNGAGKSTLLKILSRVTAPTTGKVTVAGRVASLLEVGTGFHPELTGKENIYLNGAILGMRKAEIKRKFDEIVDFAGVEKYIDTPVKRYSSGMYVRLAFAVAAHLESEILIVDEVLAVGDAEFQKKCLGKMGDVTKNHGRTILFVSHNILAIKTLCTKAVLLQHGTIIGNGEVENITNQYINSTVASLNRQSFISKHGIGNEFIKLFKVKLSSIKGDILDVESELMIEIEFINYLSGINLDVSLVVYSIDDVCLFEVANYISKNNDSKSGLYNIRCVFPANILNVGQYKMSIIFGENESYVIWRNNEVVVFELDNSLSDRGDNLSIPPGYLRPKVTWRTNITALQQ